MKKGFRVASILFLSFAFTLVVSAASGSKTGVAFTSEGTGTELIDNLSKNYYTYVTPTSNFRDRPTVNTKISLSVLWYWRGYADADTTLVNFNSPHTVHWTANTNNKTKIEWTKTNSVEAGVTAATVGYYDA